ncbi:hypothetical protein [Streptomyces lomondensis]|uniref:Transposase n=1 Tax=Streptomyces lomondensis TaxID=68229 RepID=A0ABQ2XH17_9ACTN|nr:hypothetical protein [Streptomyces lomondensis]GGX15722.1 hypothetical protein GCM10010383_52130 [Streptomyces lomondensis]
MLQDPYAVLRALVRAEAVRSAPKPSRPKPDTRKQQPVREQERG